MVQPFTHRLVSIRLIEHTLPRTGFVENRSVLHVYCKAEEAEAEILDAVDALAERLAGALAEWEALHPED